MSTEEKKHGEAIKEFFKERGSIDPELLLGNIKELMAELKRRGLEINTEEKRAG